MKAKLVNEKYVYGKGVMPTVKDLIEKLSEYPPHMPIGFSDHFGHYVELDPNDLWIHKCNDINKQVVRFPLPDIGPEPY